MRRILLFLLMNIFVLNIFSQQINLQKIEPPSWWSEMQDDTVQLLVYGKNISLTHVYIRSKKVELIKIHKAESPDYLFLDLSIIGKDEFNFDIVFKYKHKRIARYIYKIKKKTVVPGGYSSKDLIYLLMPDRFANGNESNDSEPDMLEKVDRQKPNGRHGGDIEGIIEHLDYIYNLGATTLWLNPVMENNMKSGAYHGYAITNYYKVDERLGTNALYKKMVEQAHKKGLKVIQDVIYNHCGSNHWWMKDLPFKDWIHENKNLRSNFRASTIPDPHSSASDKKQFSDGWFVESMPDLNQRNPFLANYLIQNTIWWIEYLGLDGLRIDTYAYSDLSFTTKLNKRLHREYPTLTDVGETWLQKTALIAYFQGDSPISGKYNSHLDCVTDFSLYYAINKAFNENDGWTSGLSRLYYVFTQDFLYSRANDLVIFLDNHDLDRFFSSVGKDMRKFKMGIAFLMTARGIPAIYYGTEIAMSGLKYKDDGYLRKDFPGGWKGDSTNVFTQKNMSAQQKEAFVFVKKLANWRKTNKAVTEGKFLHFVPQDNIYVYFRYTKNNAVMVILNNSDKKNKTLDCSRFNEILKNYSSGKEIISGQEIDDLKTIKIKAKSAMIIQLHK